jgi:hypothetical protein
MREDAAEQYLAYKLIDSNQDWKSKWFYIEGPIRRPERWGSEWEPIKILLEGD